MTEKAKTYDDGKLPLAWLPWAAIDDMNEVQQYGHAKYKDFNNYRKGMEVSRNLSCALRHIRDYLNGADTDHESGLNPLAHAMCRIAFVLQNIHDGTEIDDRYVAPPNYDLPQSVKRLDDVMFDALVNDPLTPEQRAALSKRPTPPRSYRASSTADTLE